MTNGNDSGNGNGNDKNGSTGKPDRDYPVGYCKPPKHSRFKPGQSGNPGGPKKGSRGLKKDLHKALDAKHSIRVNGKVVTGTTQALAMYTLATRAAAGDIRAIRHLAELVMQIFGPEDRGREKNALSTQDQELVKRLLDRHEPGDGSGDNQGGEDVGAVDGESDDGQKGNGKSKGKGKDDSGSRGQDGEA